MSNTERTDEGEALEPDEVLGPDDALDPIDTPAPPVAYSISGTAAFALRGVAHDGGRPAEELRGVIASFAGALEEWPAFVRESLLLPNGLNCICGEWNFVTAIRS